MAPRTYDRIGPRGAVSSTHHLGTAAAASVLARGGNAFDAAAACGFVLQVVEPHLCGPGGELPAVFVTAADPAPSFPHGRPIPGPGPSPTGVGQAARTTAAGGLPRPLASRNRSHIAVETCRIATKVGDAARPTWLDAGVRAKRRNP